MKILLPFVELLKFLGHLALALIWSLLGVLSTGFFIDTTISLFSQKSTMDIVSGNINDFPFFLFKFATALLIMFVSWGNLYFNLVINPKVERYDKKFILLSSASQFIATLMIALVLLITGLLLSYHSIHGKISDLHSFFNTTFFLVPLTTYQLFLLVRPFRKPNLTNLIPLVFFLAGVLVIFSYTLY